MTCAPRKDLGIRPVWSESSLDSMKKHWVLSYPLSAKQKLWLIRQIWSESSLGAHVILLVLSRAGSNEIYQKLVSGLTDMWYLLISWPHYGTEDFLCDHQQIFLVLFNILTRFQPKMNHHYRSVPLVHFNSMHKRIPRENKNKQYEYWVTCFPFEDLKRKCFRLQPHFGRGQKVGCVFGGYNNVPKFSDRQIKANSVDPDQTAPLGAVWSEEKYDQGLHYLPFPLLL